MTTDFRAELQALLTAVEDDVIDANDGPRFQRAVERARAALAEPEPEGLTPQPVPVSERLPGLEDCDAEGRCWLGGEMFAPGDPTWVLGFPAWAQRFPEVHRFWLPAHALPQPS